MIHKEPDFELGNTELDRVRRHRTVYLSLSISPHAAAIVERGIGSFLRREPNAAEDGNWIVGEDEYATDDADTDRSPDHSRVLSPFCI